MSGLHDLSVVEQTRQLRSGQLSAQELLTHYQSRIEEYGESLGAFVTLTPDLAQAEAAAADRRLASKTDEPLPPLLGIPLGYKDLHPVKGVVTTFGSRPLRGFVSDVDGEGVAALRRAGAVTVGTTHAPEFGPTCYTETDVGPRPAVTPYDTSRYASGSSGGAAAAVAAGLLPAAHASDGAGSIRTPASVCGLVGFKPSRGRAPVTASSFVSWTVEGPIARTVADAALLAGVLAPGSPHDLYRIESPDEASLAAGPLQVLAYSDTGIGDCDPEVLTAFNDAVRALEELGHEVCVAPNPRPWDDALVGAMLGVFASTVTATSRRMVPRERWPELRQFTRWCIEAVAGLDSADFVLSQAMLAQAAGAHAAAARHYDAVLTPTAAGPAQVVGAFDAEDLQGSVRRMLEWSAFTPPANMTGAPALQLPVALSSDGLPLGVQLCGRRPGADATVLTLGAALEHALAWDHHPAQWYVPTLASER
ncbi:MAG: amidase [Frankiales bacterium]|nr:amidase [Frankiales bacterium]